MCVPGNWCDEGTIDCATDEVIRMVIVAVFAEFLVSGDRLAAPGAVADADVMYISTLVGTSNLDGIAIM